ncbi:hypothetical protein IJG93_01520 [Candidatus Saccharibacteria bacterium]|nr:hypothetical protein [Candidatus Saccharibacteria bacterium]
MDGSDSGTPNPLNPMSGGMPEMSKARPTSAMPEFKEAKPVTRPANHGVIDPMMRSVPHHDNPTPESDTMVEETFDSLAVDDGSLSALTEDIATSSGPSRAEVVQTTETIDTNLSGLDGPNLVAKDSIVEPVGGKGGKKKAFIIGAIVFILIALICGAAAVAVIMLGNNGDKVSKAIEKVISGEMPTIISAQGKIEGSTELADSVQTNTATTSNLTIDFNGTFDTMSNMNKVSADVMMDYGNGQNIPLTIEEMRNKTGDTYFKISGLNNIINMFGSSSLTTNTTNTTSDIVTNCIDSVGCTGLECTNCISTSTSTSSLVSTFSGLLEVANNNWILISGDFGEDMEGLNIFDNSSTCLINAFSTLPSYSKDIMAKYKANPFIKSSSDNLGIAQKANTLYRLTFDSEKLSAFSNSLGNNGFVNELNACMDSTASNDGTSATMIEQIFNNFPTMYAEVDDNNNFTRFYFQINVASGSTSSATTADISLSYPKEFKISEPTDYITMSQLLSSVMSSLLKSDATSGDA